MSDRREYLKQYRERNKEAIKKYRETNAERERKRAQKRWRDMTGDEREDMRARGHKYRKKVKARAHEILGGKCARCGFADGRALQIDHIKPIGNKRRRGMSTVQLLRDVIKGEASNLQLLCANCNWIKRFENNEHSWNKELFDTARERSN